MAFQKKTYALKWEEGHSLHGLEVKVGGLSIGDLETMAALRSEVKDAKTFEKIMPMLEIFAKALISWNYEEAGVPIGTSLADIRDNADARDVIPVIMDWVGQVGDIPAPLERRSNSGEQFPEESLEMEEL
jgi:hypothetical protein